MNRNRHRRRKSTWLLLRKLRSNRSMRMCDRQVPRQRRACSSVWWQYGEFHLQKRVQCCISTGADASTPSPQLVAPPNASHSPGHSCSPQCRHDSTACCREAGPFGSLVGLLPDSVLIARCHRAPRTPAAAPISLCSAEQYWHPHH